MDRNDGAISMIEYH